MLTFRFVRFFALENLACCVGSVWAKDTTKGLGFLANRLPTNQRPIESHCNLIRPRIYPRPIETSWKSLDQQTILKVYEKDSPPCLGIFSILFFAFLIYWILWPRQSRIPTLIHSDTFRYEHMSNSSTEMVASPSSSQKSKDVGYRDYSRVAPQDGHGPIDITRSPASQTFPGKLHYLLTFADMTGLDKIVSWKSHGRCKFDAVGEKTFCMQISSLSMLLSASSFCI